VNPKAMLEINSRGTTFIFGAHHVYMKFLEKRGKKELKQRCETLQHLPMLQKGACCLPLLKLYFSFIVPSFPYLVLLILWVFEFKPLNKVVECLLRNNFCVG
jgi:hypothetical protein